MNFINETFYLSVPLDLFKKLYKELQYDKNPNIKIENTQIKPEKSYYLIYFFRKVSVPIKRVSEHQTQNEDSLSYKKEKIKFI